MRLNKTIAARITNDVLKHRFGADVEKNHRDWAALAVDIYEDHYPKKILKQMYELPRGWLPEKNNFNVSLSVGFVCMTFNGCKQYHTLLNEQFPISESRRFLVKDTGHSALTVYDGSTKISERYLALDAQAKTLKEEIDKAERHTKSIINSFSTMKKLMSEWPEIAPFAEKYQPQVSGLPAMNYSEINKILDLPVAAA